MYSTFSTSNLMSSLCHPKITSAMSIMRIYTGVPLVEPFYTIGPMTQPYEWPKQSRLSCWNCSEPFESRPLCLPYHYNERKDVFYTKGVFCSFSCMKRYNVDRNKGSTVQKVSSLISFLFKRLNGFIGTGVHMAPPLNHLQKFGGHLTVGAYRCNTQPAAASETIVTQNAPIDIAAPVVQKRKQRATAESSDSRRTQAAVDKIKNASKAQSTSTADSLRLKRQKRLESNAGNRLMSDCLFNTLGIVVKDA